MSLHTEARQSLGLPDDVELVQCRKCGHVQSEAGRDVCEIDTCRGALPGNALARTSGLYSTRLPEDLRISIEDWRGNLIASLGGLAELERQPVLLGLVRSLVHAETGERLAMQAVIAAGGLSTRKGQALYDKLLASIDRKLRLSLAIGLERRQRHVTSLQDALRAEAS